MPISFCRIAIPAFGKFEITSYQACQSISTNFEGDFTEEDFGR